ncbi:hypothetical protein A0H81_13374 [Grifola frondosa]|uniref:Uncharacterized protein n=1 Tax=Grifola frondosa TaxID=5627 RepID=A0A1C7LUQ1_GRIFR|nr:hypothetical protein A0H81_13374 [Grifola frondosa]
MAATLAISLLGHVLFLKNQIPFPLVQFSRMPGGHSNSRAAKKRLDLLATIDTLTSHLHTTFLALSHSLALKGVVEVTGDGRKENQILTVGEPSHKPARAHIMFVIGPSVGAARARVLLTVDGLEVKACGARDYMLPASDEQTEEVEDEDSEEEDSDEGDADEYETEDDNDEGATDTDEDEQEEDGASETSSLPPSSRSPSPSESSVPSSPASVSRSSPAPKESLITTPVRAPLAPLRTTPRVQSAKLTPVNAPSPSYAEEQQTLRAAERLLSRTLANACAEEGGGMSAELAPAQTHLFLRAPRRFAHPAWIPRQNLVGTLDGLLDAFLAGGSTGKNAKRGIPTEGVWVGCKVNNVAGIDEAEGRRPDIDEREEIEEDEMIWWTWNGKIVGFSDW